MSIIKISCPHCSRKTAVDSAKLPDRRVSFACPGCGGKVVVDPATSAGSGTTAQETVESVREATSAGREVEPSNGEGEALALPPGSSLPRGFVVSQRQEVIDALRKALDPYGTELEVVAAADEVAEVPPEDARPLVVVDVATAPSPPMAGLDPLTEMAPAERRETYLVLVADNLKTGDGSAAFFYRVNLICNTADLARSASVVYSGLQYHHRLFARLREAYRAREGHGGE